MAKVTLYLPNGPTELEIPECRNAGEVYTLLLACWQRNFPSVWPSSSDFLILDDDHLWKPTRSALNTIREVLQAGGLISCSRGRPTTFRYRLTSIASLVCEKMHRAWPDTPTDLVDGESFQEWAQRVEREEEPYEEEREEEE